MSTGPTIIDHETGEPMDGGCAKHSDHWLAKAVRQNRVGLGLPPQECQHRTGCPTDLPVAVAGANEDEGEHRG